MEVTQTSFANYDVVAVSAISIHLIAHFLQMYYITFNGFICFYKYYNWNTHRLILFSDYSSGKWYEVSQEYYLYIIDPICHTTPFSSALNTYDLGIQTFVLDDVVLALYVAYIFVLN